jgi:hypothetical protein
MTDLAGQILVPSRPYPEVLSLTEAKRAGLSSMLDHAGYAAHHAPSIAEHNEQGIKAAFVRDFDRWNGKMARPVRRIERSHYGHRESIA